MRDQFGHNNGEVVGLDEDTENFLEHFGILGMRWGVRRYQHPDGSLTPAGKIRYQLNESNEHDSGKSANSMSDDELRSAINRLEMEKRYNDLVRSNKYNNIENTIKALELQKRYSDLTKKEKSQGRKIVENLLSSIGQTAGKELGDYLTEKGFELMGVNTEKRMNKIKEKELKKLQNDVKELQLEKTLAGLKKDKEDGLF